MEKGTDGSWCTVVKRGTQKTSSYPRKVIGSRNQSDSSIKAAKIIQKKFGFHLDNVTTDLSCSDIEAFLADNGVDVIGCFSSKSWVYSKDDDPDSCHAFRVCVKLNKKSEVLDEALWPEGVIVREWKFKSKSETGTQ
jgi:hypothetical protein